MTHKFNKPLFMLHAFCLWGGFPDYVYSLYGIPEGDE